MSLSTKELRVAWKEFECARDKMVAIDFVGDRILVAPPTQEAFSALAAVIGRHGYNLRLDDTDSYNCRTITGGTEKSLHSYGIALDINWHTNPFKDHSGKRKPVFSNAASQDARALDVKAHKADTDMTEAMINDAVAICTKGGLGVFVWGGNWRSIKDAMHFEITVAPADLAVGIDWSSVNGQAIVVPLAAIPNVAANLNQPSVAAVAPSADYSDAFLQCHVLVEKWEGGFVNDPQDPGGATNLGITQDELADWRGHSVSVQDVRDLTREEARRIFNAHYWRLLRCDELPLPLAMMTYNCGVNSGPSRGGRFLQRALNRQGLALEEDGKIGKLSLDAAMVADVKKAVADYADIYEAFYRSLSTFSHFGRGWMNRLDDVEASALAFAGVTAPSSLLALGTENSMISGGQAMSDTTGTTMTTIDKMLGGSMMMGKKTLSAGAAYAGVMLLGNTDLLAVSDTTYNSVVQLIALYGGLGLASKLERSGQ